MEVRFGNDRKDKINMCYIIPGIVLMKGIGKPIIQFKWLWYWIALVPKVDIK